MPFDPRAPHTRDGVGLKSGALLMREWNGKFERVMILEEVFRRQWPGFQLFHISEDSSSQPSSVVNIDKSHHWKNQSNGRPGIIKLEEVLQKRTKDGGEASQLEDAPRSSPMLRS